MTLLCEIYKSSRKEEMYLYVDRAKGLVDVPEVLMKKFGEPQSVMVIALTPQRKLARADTVEVIAGIEEQGFYLQMPPTMAELLSRERGSD